MRQVGLNINKVIKNIMVSIVVFMFLMFLYNSFNHQFIPDKVISVLGEQIYAAEMPVYSYMNEIDSYSPQSFMGKILALIYPFNRYMNAVTTPMILGNYDEIDVVSNQNGETNASPDSNKETPTTSTTISTDQTTAATESTPQNPTTNNTQASPTTTMSAKVAEAISNNVITGTLYPKVNLENYNFLTNNFYTVDGITSLTTSILKPKELIAKDMTMTHDASSPQILIFHTHSQETFADSVAGDPNTSIIGVGEYLTQILKQKYGLNVIHDSSVYDLVNGVLDRNKAYTYSEEGIKKILAANPSIEVVIDLHRDGVPEDVHQVTDINGKQTAKIMFFNGISYSNIQGDLPGLKNPYRDDNLAMSLQMQLLGNAYYPGYLKRIYIRAYRYCLHLRPKSMLIEAGAQTNTVEEEMNAMEPLADLLNKLLSGQKAIQN